jgi:glycosyltransferase involved in cell wall biosynthesis
MTPRVLVLTPYFHPVIGGVESNALRFARYLRAAGVPVQVLTKRTTMSLPSTDAIDGVPVQRIGPLGDRSAKGKWVMLPSVLTWLVRHRDEYDVVCAIDYRGVGVAAVAARPLTGHPVMLQGQTTGVLSGSVGGAIADEGVWTRLAKWPVRTMYARADALACISRVLEAEALAYGVPRSRVHLIPNAIDMRRFAPPQQVDWAAQRSAAGIPLDQVVCVFVGRLSVEKGVLDLVAAWREAQPLPRATLLIAGPDMPGNPWDAGPRARALVEEARLGRSVQFLGPAPDVASLLQIANIAVQPSHFEALGLSAIEALACGVPVIASHVGGLPDFIDDNNGRLVPPKDIPALAAALREVVSDPSLRSRLAAHARASVAEYDEHIVFARMLAVLTELAADHH